MVLCPMKAAGVDRLPITRREVPPRMLRPDPSYFSRSSGHATSREVGHACPRVFSALMIRFPATEALRLLLVPPGPGLPARRRSTCQCLPRGYAHWLSSPFRGSATLSSGSGAPSVSELQHTPSVRVVGMCVFAQFMQTEALRHWPIRSRPGLEARSSRTGRP